MYIRKKLKAALDYMGAPYCIKTIDLEECLYRDFGNGFDVEVSGLCSRHKNAIAVYLWQVRGGQQIVERVFGIGSLVELKSVLDGLAERYGGKTA